MNNVGDLNCNPKWSHELSKIRFSFNWQLVRNSIPDHTWLGMRKSGKKISNS
jgi:hypothetical protein